MMAKIINKTTGVEQVCVIKESDMSAWKAVCPDHHFIPLAYNMTPASRQLYGELPPGNFEARVPALMDKLRGGLEYYDPQLQELWKTGKKDTALCRFWLAKLGHVRYAPHGKSVYVQDVHMSAEEQVVS